MTRQLPPVRPRDPRRLRPHHRKLGNVLERSRLPRPAAPGRPPPAYARRRTAHHPAGQYGLTTPWRTAADTISAVAGYPWDDGNLSPDDRRHPGRRARAALLPARQPRRTAQRPGRPRSSPLPRTAPRLTSFTTEAASLSTAITRINENAPPSLHDRERTRWAGPPGRKNLPGAWPSRPLAARKTGTRLSAGRPARGGGNPAAANATPFRPAPRLGGADLQARIWPDRRHPPRLLEQHTVCLYTLDCSADSGRPVSDPDRTGAGAAQAGMADPAAARRCQQMAFDATGLPPTPTHPRRQPPPLAGLRRHPLTMTAATVTPSRDYLAD